MGRPPYFQFYPADDLLLDPVCRRMSLEALGAHMKLYCLAWIEHGLPANSAELSRELGISLRRFNTLWKEISPAWEESDGRIYCQRQEEKRREYDDFVEKQRINGRKGGRPRRTQPEPKETQAFILGKPKESLSPPPSESLQKKPPPPAEAATALAQAVGETAVGGDDGGGGFGSEHGREGREVRLDDDHLFSGIAVEHRERVVRIAQRRVESGESEGHDLKDSVTWCVVSYQKRGKVYREIDGAPGIEDHGVGRELLEQLGVRFSTRLPEDVATRVVSWVDLHPQDAAEIASEVEAEVHGGFTNDAGQSRFVSLVLERAKAETPAALLASRVA